jgi:phosphomannomutase
LSSFEKEYREYHVNTADGVKVDMPEGWIHLRKSNTEPIIRLYAEAVSPGEAERLASEAMQKVSQLMN